LWNIPHQPRLDWQMWFAALGSIRDNPWMVSLMWRLLEGSPSVLALLDANPFADGPPKYVRAQLYDYRFANRRTHVLTGQWWVRRPEGVYFPQVSAADFRRVTDHETAPRPDSPSGLAGGEGPIGSSDHSKGYAVSRRRYILIAGFPTMDLGNFYAD